MVKAYLHPQFFYLIQLSGFKQTLHGILKDKNKTKQKNHKTQKNTQLEETEQASEADSDMAEMLELPD